MKCPQCQSDKITFLGIWYTRVSDDYWVLLSHYGCSSCRETWTRPVSENDYYYLKEDGSLVMRPTYVTRAHERRLSIVNIDPAYDLRV